MYSVTISKSMGRCLFVFVKSWKVVAVRRIPNPTRTHGNPEPRKDIQVASLVNAPSTKRQVFLTAEGRSK